MSLSATRFAAQVSSQVVSLQNPAAVIREYGSAQFPLCPEIGNYESSYSCANEASLEKKILVAGVLGLSFLGYTYLLGRAAGQSRMLQFMKAFNLDWKTIRDQMLNKELPQYMREKLKPYHDNPIGFMNALKAEGYEFVVGGGDGFLLRPPTPSKLSHLANLIDTIFKEKNWPSRDRTVEAFVHVINLKGLSELLRVNGFSNGPQTRCFPVTDAQVSGEASLFKVTSREGILLDLREDLRLFMSKADPQTTSRLEPLFSGYTDMRRLQAFLRTQGYHFDAKTGNFELRGTRAINDAVKP